MLLLDVAVTSQAERDFIQAIVRSARTVVATVVKDDEATLRALGLDVSAPPRSTDDESGTALARVQVLLEHIDRGRVLTSIEVCETFE